MSHATEFPVICSPNTDVGAVEEPRDGPDDQDKGNRVGDLNNSVRPLHFRHTPIIPTTPLIVIVPAPSNRSTAGVSGTLKSHVAKASRINVID